MSVCKIGDVPQGAIRKFQPSGLRPIAIYNVDGKFFATDDRCTHAGASLSDEGTLTGTIVECGRHQGSFDVRTGEGVAAPCRRKLRTYDVVVSADEICLALTSNQVPPATNIEKSGVPCPAATENSSPIPVVVRAAETEGEQIKRFELIAADGEALPRFSAGAHIDLHLGPGLIRQYSLCNHPRERHFYEIAVLREVEGRGGSRALHDRIGKGSRLLVSHPRNFFPLASSARRHLLLAGGIGITPIMAMIAELESNRASYTLHYCTRSPARTAFLDRLSPLVAAGKVVLHHDGGDPSRGFNINRVLAHYEAGTHLYYCGPQGFMAAVAAGSEHWPKDSVHFEYFSAPSAAVRTGTETAFQVKIASTGQIFTVPPELTIVDVLRDRGIAVPTSCKAGYCATCLTRYLDGTPEHRDSVLDDKDRAQFVLICCARSRTSMLVLDL